jgi:predicted DNA-binding mobile mystery protein A
MRTTACNLLLPLSMSASELRLLQMDAALEKARLAALPERPISGWLRAIRLALGMSSGVVASRLGITASGLRKLEQAEASDAITLATLRRAAEALDCELHYLLVPRRPLRDMRWQQALARARSWLQRSERTMALEAQSVETPSIREEERIKAVAEELLRSAGTRLWD